MKSFLRPSLTLLGLAIGVGAGALAAPACTNAQAECQTICQVLANCDMLPSPLGIADTKGIKTWSAQQNCEARCTASDPKEIQQLADCMLSIGDIDLNEPHAKWCTSGGCAAGAECLEQIFDDHRVAGVGTAKIELRIVDLSELSSSAEYELHKGLLQSSLGTCVDAVITEKTSAIDEYTTGVSGFCEDLDVERVELLLSNTEQVYVIASGSCSDVLGRTHISDPLPVGRYETALRVYRNSGTESVGQCSKFYGQPAVIPAANGVCTGGTCSVQIPLPHPDISCPSDNDNRTCDLIGGKGPGMSCGYPCENGGGSCREVCQQTDLDCIALANDDIPENDCVESYVKSCKALDQGIDDDCNGLSNCNDPACSVECTESGPRCNDCKDNDQDGFVDCEDKDCADEPFCSEGGESSCPDTTDTDTAGDSTDTSTDTTTDTTTDTGTDSTG